MIGVLRSHNGCHIQRILAYVLLVSCLSLFISYTCALPMSASWLTAPDHADAQGTRCGQHDTNPPPDDQRVPAKTPGCWLKPCLEKLLPSALGNAVNQAKPPPFILTLIVLFSLWPNDPRAKLRRSATALPLGRDIPLIYRYCTLRI